jgi:hypothetical protein
VLGPLAISGSLADRQPGGAVGVLVVVGLGDLAVPGLRDPCERRLDLGRAKRRQAGAGRSVGEDGG